MSVFRDFQTAWSQRFPGNDLPKAWEDDVRGNLDKHRHKLQTLKQELEKEEFYVQYLESLLQDVESKKQCPSCLSSSSSASSSSSSSASHSGCCHEDGLNHATSSGPTSDQYVTVITVSSCGEMDSKKQIDSLTENPLYQETDVQSPPSTASHQISGGRDGHVEQTPSDQPIIVDSQPKKIVLDSNNASGIKKKRPPTPPRKPKINRNNLFALQSMGSMDSPLNHVPTTPLITPEISSVIKPICLEHDNTPKKPEEETEANSPAAVSATAVEGPAIPEEPAYAVKDISEITCIPFVHENLETPRDREEDIYGDEKKGEEDHYEKCEDEVSVMENIINSEVTTDEDKDEMEESIYDTVAPDDYSFTEHQEEEEMNNLNKVPPLFDKSKSARRCLKPKLSEMHSFANYVNIDYFLRREETSSKNDSDDNDTQLSHSISSDHDIDESQAELMQPEGSNTSYETANTTYDEVFEAADYAGYYGVVESEPSSPNCQEVSAPLDDNEAIKAENERRAMYRSILSSVAESEAVYVDCLSTVIQYKKAFKASTETAHPLLSVEELEIIFYKIPDLYNIHSTFLDGIKRLLTSMDSDSISNGPLLGDLFKVLASRLGAYSSYLKNYSHALETVRKCCANNNQFSELTRVIKLKSMKGQTTTLEELLHKPVARVQKNALVLHDLLKYTKENQAEYKAVKTALKMTQCFLNELNIAATEQMFPVQDKTQRRLVKESFIIEVSEGRRKLRHLFLFNDIIVCAKYKPSTRQKFTFDVKWYTLLSDVTIPDCDESVTASSKEKELNSEIINLKCRLNSIRDMMFKEKSKPNSKVIEKLKKKQADLEGQLVLLLPQLLFVICHKSGKNYTFYLSSEFERTQWIESITVLQQSVSQTHEQINLHELQAWIETCRKALKPSLGSFLLRTSKDEDLYYGDLFCTLHSLKGLSRIAQLYFTIETDTYGHFFQKAVTKTSKDSMAPQFEQEFVIDLDGSQTLRVVCYEEISGRSKPFLRGRATIEFSRSWLQDKVVTREIPIVDSVLMVSFKFIPSEASTTRFPARKLYGAFGVNIQQVSKKEKSNVPYLIVACVREVERRGMKEVGIYRVSGLSSDVQKLKKAFESNPYEAEFLVKDIDIHAVTGLLKMYLRELPEALFTNSSYKKFFDAFSSTNEEEKKSKLIELFSQLPLVNQNTINFLIDHLAHVNEHEQQNKMSLHNLATVFGPTVCRPGFASSGSSSEDQFTAGTIDVMAQAGILYFFLKRRVLNESNC